MVSLINDTVVKGMSGNKCAAKVANKRVVTGNSRQLVRKPVTPPCLNPPVVWVLSEETRPLLRAELLCGKNPDNVSKSDSRATPLAKILEANTSAEDEGSGSKKNGLKWNDLGSEVADDVPMGPSASIECNGSTDEPLG